MCLQGPGAAPAVFISENKLSSNSTKDKSRSEHPDEFNEHGKPEISMHTHAYDIHVQLNLLVFHASTLMEDLIQLDHNLSQEHVHPHMCPVHHDEHQLGCTGRTASVPPAALQHAGLQLKRALLPPLGLRGLLHHAGRVFLLPQLDDGVHIAGAMLALAP